MKYLIITPDYTGSCIRDEFEGEIEIEKLDLPKEFINEFKRWSNSYKEIIPLSAEERKEKMNEIEKLDKQGLNLAKKLKQLIPGGAKIKYFSEGKLKYLSVE